MFLATALIFAGCGDGGGDGDSGDRGAEPAAGSTSTSRGAAPTETASPTSPLATTPDGSVPQTTPDTAASPLDAVGDGWVLALHHRNGAAPGDVELVAIAPDDRMFPVPLTTTAPVRAIADWRQAAALRWFG